MKKKLESELMSVAHNILKLKGKDDIDKMHQEVAQLYEKLTVLKFAKDNMEDNLPTIGNDSSFFEMLDTAFNNKVSDNIEVEDKVYVNLDERDGDDIMKPVMETIKDLVAQMPDETQQIDALVEEAQTQKEKANTVIFEEIAQEYNTIPEFEPVSNLQKSSEGNASKTLNDALKGNGFQIGLNDKLAFINHLFEGKNEDYDRVISQLNTATTSEEAQDFIQKLVKPDYNNWEGKEDYETRFMEIVESKFD